ncbi:TetR/AcrR family transcriptional regulator [Catellatospora tritici]|uniref:TetR/AcrR family transcriptional regulator n=1 Tax=Catellatospora tritici TaxID=2851566 RepID=UPI001C2D9E47|nr:TetR/AcrR family transcriptional regulator [Catellatospora tritici]MBV1848966.1 TetR/AcrR family transcriptional regulator [Catellatospora tritici]
MNLAEHRADSRPDTRARIQAVALELFTEHGYDATSLREIAERLGVTKAALYYHFKSKEEIVDSFSADHIDKIREIVEWGQQQERTPQFRHDFLLRYADQLHRGQHHQIMKFFHQNQPAIKNTQNGARMKDVFIQVINLLADPATATPTDRLRAGLAVMSLHASWLLLENEQITDDQRREASVEVALELIDRPA